MKLQLAILFLVLSLSSAYTPTLARELAFMSIIAYDSPANINAWNCAKCPQYPMTNVKVFSNSVGDIQGFTGYSAKTNSIILSFRGSSNIQNWIINLSITQVAYAKCSGCKVHNGFLTGYNLVKNTVISQLQALHSLYRNAKIYATGHSLGGAFAVLATPDIKEAFGSITGLYTFGQPRVGNAQFAAWFPSVTATIRVVHYADIVPHIPPAANGFAHEGT